MKGNKHISSPKLIASWIDQAQTYYLDAVHCDWRSAGLLYYYSFLNLAKAFLVGKKKFSYKALDTTSVNHGLSANLQYISSLSDFELQVYPPKVGSSKNVFSSFYEIVCGSKWPYTDKFTIKLGDIMGYCDDISLELSRLYGISKTIIRTQSLHREIEGEMWFEMIVHKDQIDIVKNQFSEWNLQFLTLDQLSVVDREEWLSAFR